MAANGYGKRVLVVDYATRRVRKWCTMQRYWIEFGDIDMLNIQHVLFPNLFFKQEYVAKARITFTNPIIVTDYSCFHTCVFLVTFRLGCDIDLHKRVVGNCFSVLPDKCIEIGSTYCDCAEGILSVGDWHFTTSLQAVRMALDEALQECVETVPKEIWKEEVEECNLSWLPYMAGV